MNNKLQTIIYGFGMKEILKIFSKLQSRIMFSVLTGNRRSSAWLDYTFSRHCTLKVFPLTFPRYFCYVTGYLTFQEKDLQFNPNS
jgi:hypothetical protein